MNILNKDNIIYLLNYLEFGEKGIVKLLSTFFLLNYRNLKFNINGFILNESMREWYCSNFKFNYKKINIKLCFKCNYINCLKFLCDNDYYNFYNNIDSYQIYPAIRKKNHDIIKFIFKKGRPIKATDFKLAIISKNKYLIDYYLNNLTILEKYLCCYSIRSGDLSLLKKLRKMGCPWDSNTSNIAADFGYFHILKWAFQNGCPIDSETISLAGKKGRLEIVKWLYKNDCPVDVKLGNYAAYNGYLSILKWCNQNNIILGKDILKIAKDRNHIEILNWITKNNINLS